MKANDPETRSERQRVEGFARFLVPLRPRKAAQEAALSCSALGSLDDPNDDVTTLGAKTV